MYIYSIFEFIYIIIDALIMKCVYAVLYYYCYIIGIYFCYTYLQICYTFIFKSSANHLYPIYFPLPFGYSGISCIFAIPYWINFKGVYNEATVAVYMPGSHITKWQRALSISPAACNVAFTVGETGYGFEVILVSLPPFRCMW